jgi:exopolyphosphatase/guanosine-5'-triphosphate,3'-diphosphate pyrophosphatase
VAAGVETKTALEAIQERAPGRIYDTGPVAIIDIGSNSVRLVVYERLSRTATPLFNEKELCELARGVAASGRLHPHAIASALRALRRFRLLCSQMGVTAFHVLATAAALEAVNGPDFIASVEAITGVPVSLLSGAEEARLTALGVISGIGHPDGIAGDLGGGSLELIDVAGKQIGQGETFPLGGVRLEDASDKSVKKAEKITTDLTPG